jgi:hypothetical protein
VFYIELAISIYSNKQSNKFFKIFYLIIFMKLNIGINQVLAEYTRPKLYHGSMR